MGVFRKSARRIVHKNAPRDTVYERRLAYCGRLEADLAELGYGVRDPRNLRAVHLWALARLWLSRMSPASVRNLVSLFRQIHGWAGSSNRLPTNEQLGLRRETVSAAEQS